MPEGVENPLMPYQSYLNVLCPAKVNLILRVGPRRPDGYHEIESLMSQIGWGDRLDLKVKQASETRIFLVGSIHENMPPNLKFPSLHVSRIPPTSYTRFHSVDHMCY